MWIYDTGNILRNIDRPALRFQTDFDGTDYSVLLFDGATSYIVADGLATQVAADGVVAKAAEVLSSLDLR